MRTFAGIMLSILAISVIVGLGAGVYNAGIQQGIIEAGRVPAGQAVQTGYHYGWGAGFNFFDILIPLLFLFILFGLIRAAFGGGRGWGHGYRGYGPGGYGPGAWGRGWDADRGPGGWREERERRMADLHRRFHEAEAGSSGSPSGGDPSAGARAS